MASVVVIKDGLHTAAHPSTPTVGIVTAEEARLSQAAGWARSSLTAIGARQGVVYAGVSTLLTGTATTAPSMQVAVAPLTAVCQKAPAEGVYTPTNVGTTLLDVAAAPGSNSRVDVVYTMQRDASSTTAPDTLTQAELGVVTGTAAVSPVKPAIPPGAVEVGTVTVPSGATATTGCTIATTCLWTAPLGSPVPCRNGAERVALVGYDGLTARQLDTDQTWVHNGATWALAVSLPTYFGALATTTLFANTPYGVGPFVVNAGGSVVTGSGDTLTFPVAGLVTLSALFYVSDGTRAKYGLIKANGAGSGDAQTSTFTLDRATVSYTTRVAAGTTLVFNQWMAAGGNAGSTCSVQGMFTPAYL